ncbi:MAG: hypothetical protein AB1489_23810, partial [Acidobacteriota bacterium]
NFLRSVIFNFELLTFALSIPLLLLAGAGMIVAIAQNYRLARLLIIITLIYLYTVTLIVPHRELRFFLHIYPALFFFIGCTIKLVWKFLAAPPKIFLSPRSLRLIVASLLLAILAGLLNSTAQEIESFASPAYRNDILLRLARYVKEHTNTNNKAIWVGDYFDIRTDQLSIPEKTEFGTDSYYLFQANANSISYFSNRRIYDGHPNFFLQHVSLQKFGGSLQSSDLILLNTGNMQSLYVYTFTEPWSFVAESAGSGSGIFLESKQGQQLRLTQVEDGLEVRGQAAPFLIWRLILNNDVDAFMYGRPVLQFPYLLKTRSLKLADLKALMVVPLGKPQEVLTN